ncbi:MAG TPA: hypothetical protein VKA44_00570 [Gemmatimonadota bacterium]|nr:hypothetical protein [Gemmatimonadota bacterium]
MSTTKTLSAGLVLGLALAVPGPVLAQGQMGQGQKMGQMQQQMARMQDMMQRMDRMQVRIHQMDQAMSRQMDQLRTRDQAAAQDGTPDRDRLRDQDRDRLMEHQQLHDMLQSTGDMVRQMARGMDRLRSMMGDPAFQGDQAMNRHMEQLQERFRNMADQMDGSLQLMEQMQQRLQERAGSTPGGGA